MTYQFKGTPIYKTETFKELCANMVKLLNNGYTESRSKPALFYRKGLEGEIYFADMRGTDIVPMWSDTSPLFYANFPSDMPHWKRSRLASAEYKKLSVCRISYEFDSTEYAISVPELGIYMSNGNGGYCEQCGADFGGDGDFCSSKCADMFEELHSPHCSVCNKRLSNIEQTISHHLNYAKDITILVCRSCHLKIHRGTALSIYKPVDGRIIRVDKQPKANDTYKAGSCESRAYMG